ncbi:MULTISPECIES: glycosyltransferase family 2 protein [Caldilinea]|uniref:glycosyltransferase family 2 protein n=1 Tax=Caldilinea TaxID=233191 RepID=UPI001B172841|nr:glycosyltransferase family 2 protein [Caldilinea sp.]MBO9392558.1 glycosyltransferase family 2 protein [Caldilinea sp.]GIV72998.1 MAG: glycosyl transferase [Caldilinea sp.]
MERILNTVLLSIVIPCYNEADNVDKLLTEFLPTAQGLVGMTLPTGEKVKQVEVIFVDDGSKDGTYAALKAAFGDLNAPDVVFRFERHEVNRGLGAALRTGFAATAGEVVVTTDSDGTYRFETIPALLACLQPGISIVTASPYAPGGAIANVPGYRIFLSKGSSLLYRLLVNPHVHTYTALFRAYRREVIERIPFESNGFLAGTELMVNAMLAGYKVAEYPTTLYSRAFGASKAKILRTIRAHLGFQGNVLLRRLKLAPPVQPLPMGGRQKLVAH